MYAGLKRGGVEDVEVVEVLVPEGDGDKGRARRVDAPQDKLRPGHRGGAELWSCKVRYDLQCAGYLGPNRQQLNAAVAFLNPSPALLFEMGACLKENVTGAHY